MIEVAGASARTEATRGTPSSVVRGATFRWERGLLVLLGAPADGTTALLGALGGDLALRGGTVRIDGVPVDLARARIALVPLAPVLPHGATVAELWMLARSLRGGVGDASSALSALDVERLANRPASSLSVVEQRTVLLAFALASPGVETLLVEEPLASLDAAALLHVEAALRARADDGVVIATTSSVRDAARLADEVLVVAGGITAAAPPGWLHTARSGARVSVAMPAGDERSEAFGRALAADGEAVLGVEREAGDEVLVVQGHDLVPVARAIARAAHAAGLAVRAVEPDVVPLAQVQAAALDAGARSR